MMRKFGNLLMIIVIRNPPNFAFRVCREKSCSLTFDTVTTYTKSFRVQNDVPIDPLPLYLILWLMILPGRVFHLSYHAM
jgi:hypothetical protein